MDVSSRSDFIEFLSIKIELWQDYHNHKENMANAGF